MNEANILCIKFNFGVPLEDIFPPNDIHPRLQNLFHQTRVALKNSDLPLTDILKGLDISLNEALELKEAVIKKKLRYSDDISPSSFLWLLRHFFGLLPIPLFPCFTNGQSYNWEYLSTHCRFNKLKSSHLLESEISWWIHKLPKANILLIYRLIKFLRKISLRNCPLKRLDWDSVKAVTIYFASSLFCRPYRPGFVRKTDTLYYPLLYYLIVNWPRIRRVKHDLEDKLSSVLEYEELSSVDTGVESMKNRFVDISCQTSSWLLLEKNSKSCFGAVSKSILEKEGEVIDIDECPHNTEVSDSEKLEIISALEEERVEEENKSKFNFSKKENEKKEETFDNIENKPLTESNIGRDCASNLYEEISDERDESANSETSIYKKNQKNRTPQLIKQKIARANRSLVNVVSKMNEKLKSKQDQLKSRSGSKLEKYKYDLLKDSGVKKIHSLHASHGVKESPNIKYKKLKTL